MSSQPDLTAFVVLHRTMRTDARRFADAVARVDELDRTARVPVLARWYGGFQAELHDHHVIEDDIFLPALVDRVPAAAELVSRVDVDHDASATSSVASESCSSGSRTPTCPSASPAPRP
jgi:hypothetical protein